MDIKLLGGTLEDFLKEFPVLRKALDSSSVAYSAEQQALTDEIMKLYSAWSLKKTMLVISGMTAAELHAAGVNLAKDRGKAHIETRLDSYLSRYVNAPEDGGIKNNLWFRMKELLWVLHPDYADTRIAAMLREKIRIAEGKRQ